MNIYVLDRDLDMQGMVENYISMQWERDYLGEGSLELHCDLTKDNLSLLQIGNLVYKSNSDEAAVITHRELTQDEEGNEILIILGHLLEGILAMRVVWEDKTYTGTSENIVRELITHNLINPANVNRRIDNIILGASKGLGVFKTIETEKDNVFELATNILREQDLGLYGSLDIINKQIAYEVYNGEDKSVNNQVGNSPVIFNQDFDNIIEQNFTESMIDHHNAALVFGEEGTTHYDGNIVIDLPQVIGKLGDENKGLDRFEMVIDMSNIERGRKQTEDYRQLIESRGVFTLNEFAQIQSFEGEIDLYGNFEYGVDYNLGDIVTCKSNKWDIELDIRITSILEIYEEDGMKIEVTFGNPIPTLMEKIRKVVK